MVHCFIDTRVQDYFNDDKEREDYQTPKFLKRKSSFLFFPVKRIFQRSYSVVIDHDDNKTLGPSRKHSFEGLPAEEYIDKCVICMEHKAEYVFMECGHGGICEKCSNVLFTTTKLCHFCRKNIREVLKISQIDSETISVVASF